MIEAVGMALTVFITTIGATWHLSAKFSTLILEVRDIKENHLVHIEKRLNRLEDMVYGNGSEAHTQLSRI